MLRQNWGVDGVTRRKKHDQSRTTLDWLQGSGHRSELADPNDVEAFRDLFAWDVARLVHVARHAFHAGFLDEDDAWSYIAADGPGNTASLSLLGRIRPTASPAAAAAG